MDWDAIREEFPALRRGIVHLDTASFGQLATRTMSAVMRHFSHRDETACHDFLTWFDDVDRTRVAVAQLINASSDDIAFVNNAATALGILMSGIEWREGDEVLALEHEFPNNLYAPAALSRRGVVFRECDWAGLDSALSERTRLVLLSTVNYTTGFRPPLSGLGERLRKRGVLLYVDGTQSVGALKFDAADVQPTMLAVHGYKWLLCPNGAAFAYVPAETRAWLEPNIIGWRSHRDWRNVDNLHHGRPELPARAEKYEGGMLPFPLICAMDAAVNMQLEIGPALIERRVMKLAAELRDILERAGATVPDHDSQIVTASFRRADPTALRRALEEQHVFVSARRGSLRVSAHFYNNLDDVMTFEAALRRALTRVK
ncbi:MAG TPA: aminotransferase class V-fold PLP-dependent enzyme [Bryobacteraceae bacterium]|nr:aminotransferase class V-fold PLP-dependent enzyme [Bryobacteraceae bacterium]